MTDYAGPFTCLINALTVHVEISSLRLRDQSGTSTSAVDYET